ncbi:unnamed protein product, partial [Aphanomyces euteiches]
EPNDLVMIDLSRKIQGKMLPAPMGPFPVVAVRPNGTVLIDRGRYIETINIRRLIPHPSGINRGGECRDP